MKLICCLILNLYGHNARDSLGSSLELVSSSFDAMLFYVCVWGGGWHHLQHMFTSVLSRWWCIVQRGQIISKWATTTTVRTSCFIGGAGKIVQNELSPLKL